jgi:hypothetical protein
MKRYGFIGLVFAAASVSAGGGNLLDNPSFKVVRQDEAKAR